MSKNNQRISLVLGSGGARGLAHIGIIQELEAQGYEIASICGCSMGALIGGIYAAGKLSEFESWVRAIDKIDIFQLLDLSWGKDGLVKGDKVISALVQLVGDCQISELPIRFTAVAADINHEREVWLNEGSLFYAIRASISLPLFFTPVPYKDTYLVDGGVLNPVPIAPTFHDGTDFTLAVNLGAALQPDSSAPEIVRGHAQSSDSIRAQVKGFIQSIVSSSVGSVANTGAVGMYDVANQSFDAMQSAIARQKLAAYPPDHIIEIARNACGTLEFNRADEMIELGREKAKQLLLKVNRA